MRRRTFLAVCLAPGLAGEDSGRRSRFQREVLDAWEPADYAVAKVDGFDAPAISVEKLEVSCLAYRDAARLYLELEIRNRTGKDLEIAKNFATVEQAGKKLVRTRTSAVAKDVETEALRPFVPKARERAAIDEEARRHFETQENGVAFASLLQTFAQESGPAEAASGEELTIACTFEAPKNDRDLLSVIIRVGDQDFRFRFRPSAVRTRS